MKKRFRKLLCCFLAFTLMFTSIEWSGITQSIHSVKAEETQKETKTVEQKEVIKSEKTKNSTTFALANGKKQTVFYGQDVRFETKNGKLKDYDPSLVKIQKKKSENGNDLKDYAYENEEGDKKHYLPKNLTEETPVLMENGQYQISFAPIYGQKTKKEEEKQGEQGTDTVQQAITQAEQAVQDVADHTDISDEVTDDTQDALDSVDNLQRTKLENAEVEDAEENKIEKPVKVSYESQQKECTFSYESLNTGIKESIVLTKAPEGNVLKFRFKASGLVPKKNVLDEGISFLDEKTDEIVAALEAPNMNDATGKAYSEKISYDIDPDNEEEDSYILTLHLDEEYFKDKDRKYPVTIGSNRIMDRIYGFLGCLCN